VAPRLLAAVFAVVSAAALVAQSPPARPALDITRITGNLYRGTAGGLHNVFLVLFPTERVAYAVDFIADGAVSGSLQSLPGAWGDFDHNPMAGFIDSMKAVEALDFDVFAAGEGRLGTKADVTAMRQFFEDLRSAVAAGLSQGKSLAELQDTLMLEKYKGWAGYDQRRRLNIEAAYNNLRLYR